MRHSLFLLCCVVLIISSCIDQSEYQLDELQVNPSMALPLVNGDLTLNDFLNDEDSANIKIYPDGLLYLAYQQELRTQGVEALFEVPDKTVTRSFVLPTLVLPPLPKDVRSDSIVQEIDLGMSPELLSEIALKTGQLNYTTSVFPANAQFDYEVQLALPDFISRSTNLPLKHSAKGSGTLALGDYTVFLNDNKFDLKLVLVIKKTANPVNIVSGTTINVELNFGGMDFKHIKGFFGAQTTQLPDETLDIGVFKNAFEGVSVSLAAPKMSLTIVNEYGVPCLVDFKKLEARKPGAVLPVALNPVNPVKLNSPVTLGASATTNLSVVNVNDLLSFSPTQFFYSSEVRINEGVSSGNNFLADTSKLKVKMSIEVPFYGHASNIIIRDTVEIDLSNADQSQIEKAALKLKLTNQLPLDGVIQFYLTDKTYTIIETLLTNEQTNIVKGSKVNTTTGLLEQAGSYDNTIEIERARIEKIFQAKHLIIVATLSTSKDASGNYPNVKFKSDYALSIEAGILATLKLNVKL